MTLFDTAGRKADEGTLNQKEGFGDMHWELKEPAEAQAMLERLSPFVKEDWLILLKLKDWKNPDQSITLKDARPGL